MEYKIEIAMTPHEHDSLNAPYFWSVICSDGKFWVNGGFGWATSPEEAWKRANECYKDLKENTK